MGRVFGKPKCPQNERARTEYTRANKTQRERERKEKNRLEDTSVVLFLFSGSSGFGSELTKSNTLMSSSLRVVGAIHAALVKYRRDR